MRPMCNLACVAAGSNAITFKQFCEALKGFLIPHTEQAARDLFSELDINGDGTCDYSKFLKGVMRTDTRVKHSLDRDQGLKMTKIREMRLSSFANKPITNAKVLMKEIRRKVWNSDANSVLMWRPTKTQVTSAFRRFHKASASGTQSIDRKHFNVSYCLALQRIYDCMSPG